MPSFCFLSNIISNSDSLTLYSFLRESSALPLCLLHLPLPIKSAYILYAFKIEQIEIFSSFNLFFLFRYYFPIPVLCQLSHLFLPIWHYSFPFRISHFPCLEVLWYPYSHSLPFHFSSLTLLYSFIWRTIGSPVFILLWYPAACSVRNIEMFPFSVYQLYIFDPFFPFP